MQTFFGWHRLQNFLAQRSGWAVMLGGLLMSGWAAAADGLATKLRELDSRVLSNEDAEKAVGGFQSNLRRRMTEANEASTAAWRKIANRAEWESFRQEKLAALKASLGEFPAERPPLETQLGGSLNGDGFRVDKVVFASRAGLWITANLYRPATATAKMPGIVIAHSHHNPKTQAELQDMGATWARAGCLVLVPDLFGHGERREHPFHGASDFAVEYRVSRQDYYFRYDSQMQLQLSGQSLMGQNAWDLWRCVDLLLAEPGIDPKRIVLMGAVAGGGDPCAVAAALDDRIAAAVPFNFGGPQPESRFPLPADAEAAFNYAGGGSWESTRNLTRSAADGFLPWVIVGSIAPRRLVYAHEFSWDRERDPVWKRFLTIYERYGVAEHLAHSHGSGSVKGQAPESTHCNNIGAVHRKAIHAALERWFQIPDQSAREYSQRFPAEDLRCWTPALREKLRPKTLRDVGREQAAQVKQPATVSKSEIRARWAKLLGPVEPREAVRPRVEKQEVIGDLRVTRFVIETETDIAIPVLLLAPSAAAKAKVPVVFAVAQHGKDKFLKQRADEIATLLASGVAVCLPDLRATGESSPSSGRDRPSSATSYSATEQMLGGTLVGARLRDLRSVLSYVRSRAEIDGERMAIWGDSFAPINAADSKLLVPHGIDGRAKECEPLGGLLALLLPLFEDNVRASYSRGGLVSYASIMQSPCVYLPHDAVIPSAIPAGDVAALVAAVAPVPLRADALVDATNRSVAARAAADIWKSATPVVLEDSSANAMNWLLAQINK